VPSSERSHERDSGVVGVGVDGVDVLPAGADAGVAVGGGAVGGIAVLAAGADAGVAVGGVAVGGAGGVAEGGAAVAGVAVGGGADGVGGVAEGGVAVGGVAVGAGAQGDLVVGGPAGRRGAVGGVRIADSNRLNASLVSPARASAAPATCSLNPAEDPPESLALRAARQIGHHWHSGGSSVGSVVVASSQTSV
jgi:hypothetical protein